MRRITPSLVIAVLALVLACSGGAFAASSYITGKQIKDSSVTGADIKNKSLTTADFKGKLFGQDGLDGKDGAPGPQGPAGPQGPQGPAGPSNVTALNRYAGTLTVAAGDIDGGTVYCPAGQRAVSGGFFTDSNGPVFAFSSTADRTGWVVAVDNSASSLPSELDGYVFCAGAGTAVAARAHTSGKLAPVKDAHLSKLIAARKARS
jgi:hypothetical protein